MTAASQAGQRAEKTQPEPSECKSILLLFCFQGGTPGLKMQIIQRSIPNSKRASQTEKLKIQINPSQPSQASPNYYPILCYFISPARLIMIHHESFRARTAGYPSTLILAAFIFKFQVHLWIYSITQIHPTRLTCIPCK